jgi:putative membrane protein
VDPHSWSLHWDVLLAIGVLAAGYFWSQRRWPADATRRVAFDLAVILLLAVYVTPLHTIALHYLLSVHLLQNVVTAEWAPGLVVFALAPAFAREVERSAAVRLVTHPLVALPVWLGTYFLWHVPPIYDFYKDAPQLWGLSDETDQQIAGVTMAVEQAIVFFAVFAYFFMRFLRTEHIAGVFSESSR